jgi:hypothetical protein
LQLKVTGLPCPHAPLASAAASLLARTAPGVCGFKKIVALAASAASAATASASPTPLGLSLLDGNGNNAAGCVRIQLLPAQT